MPKTNFVKIINQELKRLDQAQLRKRQEKLIEGFTTHAHPRAIIANREYQIFNSNDYLGLRHHPLLKSAEHQASQNLGTGPGAVRFISGSFALHRQLEKALAEFHGRDDALVFSSAFAANLATIFSLIKGQSKDSLLNDKVLVISDELNHRSIIDGVRLAGLNQDQKAIFKHMDAQSLEAILKDNVGKFDRAVVISDGVFSMLGEYQDLNSLSVVIKKYDALYPNGVISIIDDCHGVGACGNSGRGIEEIFQKKADVLVGTLGKALGADGGYVAADQAIIDYLRESAATYIYSNSISPGTAAAALAAIQLIDSKEGRLLLSKLRTNIEFFKSELGKTNLQLASPSVHPIQPILVGDPILSKSIAQKLYTQGYLVTSINYPVVAKTRDEIRVQINATHTHQDIQDFVRDLNKIAVELQYNIKS